MHVGQNVKYWSHDCGRLLVATKVKASMSSVMYKVFLLFVIDSSMKCRLVCSFCECVNGVLLLPTQGSSCHLDWRHPGLFGHSRVSNG